LDDLRKILPRSQYGRTTTMTYGDREREFTFAKTQKFYGESGQD